ncbi:MAG: hypothetical protein ABIH21_03635 [Patescibacteria group bacterium]
MTNDEVTTNEIMDFLKEKMVTKDEMRVYVKDEITNAKDEIITTVDRFAKLHETLDLELVALRSKYDRLEGRIEILEQKAGVTP